jgi:hypothetical protein
MALRVALDILNQKGTPAFYSDTFANRPAFGFAGRVFISTDTGAIYEDTGTSWTLIADAGAGTTGTLQQVTTNGNTTTNNIVLNGSQLFVYNGASNVRAYYDNASSYVGSTTFGVFGNYTTGGGLRFEVNNNLDTFILNADYTASFVGNVTAPNLTLSSFTAGSVLFAGASGLLSQKNANFFWDNTNNRLGIGTASPGAPLDIHGTGTAAQFNGTGTNNAYIQLQSAGVSKWRIGNTYSAGANNYDIYNNTLAANALSFIGSTNVAFFSNSVGIGTGTPIGSFNINSANTTYTNSLNTAYTLAQFRLQPNNLNSAGISMGSISGNLQYIQSQLSDGSTTTSLCINPYGANTIIGTSNDNGNKLQLSGGSPYFSITSTTNSRTFLNGVDSNGYVIYDNTASAYRLAIPSTGNILINTTTDAGYKLDVNGTVKFSGALTGTSSTFSDAINLTGTSNSFQIASIFRNANRIFFGGDTGGYFFQNSANSATLIQIADAGTITISNLAGTGSRAVLADASGNLSAPVSDISVKENIIPIGYGLNEILKMKPVWFDFINEYKNYGQGRQNGNIAQEIEQIIPEAVFTTPSTNKMGINYDQLHAIYIKAIQELNDKIEKLQNN